MSDQNETSIRKCEHGYPIASKQARAKRSGRCPTCMAMDMKKEKEPPLKAVIKELLTSMVKDGGHDSYGKDCPQCKLVKKYHRYLNK